MSINDKIKQVLIIKNLSPSYLADDIGVQRSSISHILSGRNRPSLDIIQKIVRRFPEFTYEWFLESDIQLTTDEPQARVSEQVEKQPVNSVVSLGKASRPTIPAQPVSTPTPTIDHNQPAVPKPIESPKPSIDRILIFYADGTFREYLPA